MSRARSPGEERPLPRAPAPEGDRVPGALLWLTATGASMITVAAVLVAGGVLDAERGGAATAHAPPAARAPDQLGIVEQTPILSTRRGLAERATQRESLDHFGWSDRARGLAKIPIDRAMDLVAEPAFMARAFPAPTADAGTEGGL